MTSSSAFSDRERKVVALLRTLYAWCPGPKISSHRGAETGEVAAKRIPCKACGGGGKRRVRGLLQRCEACLGHGYRVVDPQTHREVIATRKYDPSEVAAELVDHFAQIANAPADERGLHRLRERERAERIGGRDLEALDEPGDRLTRAHEDRERQYAEGDYAALEQRLAELRRLDLRRHSHVLVAYVPECHPEIYRLSETQVEDAAEGVRWLAGVLPEPLRVPGWARGEQEQLAGKGRWANRAAQADFHVKVVECYFANGNSSLEAGRLLGISDRRVRQIVASAVSAVQGSAA